MIDTIESGDDLRRDGTDDSLDVKLQESRRMESVARSDCTRSLMISIQLRERIDELESLVVAQAFKIAAFEGATGCPTIAALEARREG